jgi:hypothetical protein
MKLNNPDDLESPRICVRCGEMWRLAIEDDPEATNWTLAAHNYCIDCYESLDLYGGYAEDIAYSLILEAFQDG